MYEGGLSLSAKCVAGFEPLSQYFRQHKLCAASEATTIDGISFGVV